MSKLRVMVVDEHLERQEGVAKILSSVGCEVVASLKPEERMLPERSCFRVIDKTG